MLCISCSTIKGAGGGIRTRKAFPPTASKAVAFTCFATPANSVELPGIELGAEDPNSAARRQPQPRYKTAPRLGNWSGRCFSQYMNLLKFVFINKPHGWPSWRLFVPNKSFNVYTIGL